MTKQVSVIIHLSEASLQDTLFFMRFKSILKTLCTQTRSIIVISSQTSSVSSSLENIKLLCSKFQDDLLPVIPIASHYLETQTHTLSPSTIERFFISGTTPIVAPLTKKDNNIAHCDSKKLAIDMAKIIHADSVFFLYSPSDDETSLDTHQLSPYSFCEISELESQIRKILCM